MNQVYQRQIFLRDVLTVLFKRKWQIFFFALTVLVVVYLGNHIATPVYESSATIRLMRGREVSQTDPTVTQSQSVPMVALSLEDVNSEIELIASTTVRRRVVEEMNLAQRIRDQRDFWSILKGSITQLQYLLHFQTRPSPEQKAMSRLEEALVVEPVRDSHVLELRMHLGSPDLAHDVLEKVLKVYKEEHIELFSHRQTETFFEEQLARIEEQWQGAQKELQDFINEFQITSLEEEKRLWAEQYADARRILVQLEETQIAAQAISEDLDDRAITQLLARETGTTVVRELQLRLLELMLDRNRIGNTVGPKHPDMLTVNEGIERAVARLRQAIEITREITERKLSGARNRLSELGAQLAQYEELQRKVAHLGDTYEYYSQKLEESRVINKMTEQEMSNVRITSPPTLPVNPVRPKKLLNLALALAGGILGGLSLAFFLEYLYRGIRMPEDVESFFGIPPLASFFKGADPKLNPREVNRLNSMLELLHSNGELKVTQINSSIPGEGARRLATAMAESLATDPEKRTLFIDCSSGTKVGVAGSGLLNVLLGEDEIDSVIVSDNNLHVMGRGAQVDCPMHLYNSNRIKAIMQRLRENYDHIVLHAPPVLTSHEALSLAQHADGVVLVIKAEATRREVVQSALSILHKTSSRILGAVLMDRRQFIPNSVYKKL